MKVAMLLLTAVLGMLMSLPVVAHYNCNAGDDVCPEEIGDYMGYHEDAYLRVEDLVGCGAMSVDVEVEDPADVIGGEGRNIDIVDLPGTATRFPTATQERTLRPELIILD